MVFFNLFCYEIRVICLHKPLLLWSTLVKYWQNDFSKIWYISIISIIFQWFTFQLCWRSLIIKVLVTPALNNFWFLFFVENFQKCNDGFIKIWYTCFYDNSVSKTSWTNFKVKLNVIRVFETDRFFNEAQQIVNITNIIQTLSIETSQKHNVILLANLCVETSQKHVILLANVCVYTLAQTVQMLWCIIFTRIMWAAE